MPYRYSLYTESRENEKLGALAAAAAKEVSGLPYIPTIHFFKEDPAGRFEHPIPVLGFINVRSSQRLDICVRGGRSPSDIVESVFHESEHLAQYHKKQLLKLNHQETELLAFWRATLAPSGSTYAKVYGELAFKLTRLCIRLGDFERARKYHAELATVNPQRAAEMRDDLLTPKEKRLKISMEAERVRRQVEEEVTQAERQRRLPRW